MKKIISLPWQTIKEESLDIALAKKAKNGDSDAFTELYNMHKIYLYKIAGFFTEKREHIEASFQASDMLPKISFLLPL